jgi:hypothetical protein
MPVESGSQETRTMRYAIAILLGALALLMHTISARNGKRETVDRGPGKRDKATVDRRDKTKGCEKVRRPRRR